MNNKKIYQCPMIEVIDVKAQQQLLAGSMGVSETPIGNGDAVLSHEDGEGNEW